MNAKKFSDAMSELDNKYIDEALNYKKKVKKPIWIKWGAMVASLLLVFTMSVPALAAADFGPAYNLLYKVSPAIAQKLKPVRMSCEDNGIKFEVISAYVEGSEAKIFISAQDIDGDKITYNSTSFEQARDLKAKIIQWVPVEDNVNVSIVMDDASTKTGLGEGALKDLKVGDVVQFERVGFARLDEIKDNELVFYYAHK